MLDRLSSLLVQFIKSTRILYSTGTFPVNARKCSFLYRNVLGIVTWAGRCLLSDLLQ